MHSFFLPCIFITISVSEITWVFHQEKLSSCWFFLTWVDLLDENLFSLSVIDAYPYMYLDHDDLCLSVPSSASSKAVAQRWDMGDRPLDTRLQRNVVSKETTLKKKKFCVWDLRSRQWSCVPQQMQTQERRHVKDAQSNCKGPIHTGRKHANLPPITLISKSEHSHSQKQILFACFCIYTRSVDGP